MLLEHKFQLLCRYTASPYVHTYIINFFISTLDIVLIRVYKRPIGIVRKQLIDQSLAV